MKRCFTVRRMSALALLVFLAAPACKSKSPAEEGDSGGSGARRVTIGYSAPELAAAQATVIQKAFLERARAKGWEVLTANANFDPKTQASQIEYFLSRGVDAVVAVPADSAAVCASVEKARQARVPFYTIDRAPLGCEVRMSVLADNRMAGRQAGEALVRMLGERHGQPRGTVLEYQGNLSQNVAQLRRDGFLSVMERYPEIKVLSRRTDWESEKVAAITREILPVQTVDAIYLHSDCLGIPVVLPILDQLGQRHPRGHPRHVLIAGVDGGPEALQAIRDGAADQSSSQPLPDFALIVDYIEKDLRREPFVAGPVVREGAPWSPATLAQGPAGWCLLLATTSVTSDNVNQASLWANQLQQVIR
ncbi:MAG: sugar ABC transporter substrate-binding protein [Deltaproteobacteria bacterium]|nr:sugar ABC transporter substrate-binding protein [Deltaproteobacteria bacterium]